jgi:acyl carrier protein
MQGPQVLSRVIDTIFTAVKIRGVDRDRVDAAMTLGRGGLELDSVDILEIVVTVEHEFQVKIPDKAVGHAVFQSIGSIARFVETHSPLFAAATSAP